MIMAEVAAQLKNSGLANTQIREAMHSTEFNARMHAFRKRGGQTINKMPLLKQALGRYANNDLQKGAEQLAEKYRQTPNRFDSDVHPVEQTPGLGFENNIRG